MAVPDTNTFTLQDVVDEINPTTDDLVDCFADAISGNFDASYSGSKNNLLNFRNYKDTFVEPTTYPVSVSPTGRSDSSSACGDTASVTRYSSEDTIRSGDIIYEDSEGFNRFDGGGKWFKFGTDQAFIISSMGVLGTGTFCG